MKPILTPASATAVDFTTLATLTACAAVLAGCMSTARTEEPRVTRTAAPVGYERSILSYFALTIREQPKNRKVDVSQPQPGGCPVGGRITSERGWVVPVSYTTYSGVPGGRDVVTIVTRDYYFWFRESTIAGVTSKLELCP